MRTTVRHIGLTEDDDPNAPVTEDDSVTVDEDGSVAFDPIANDTDADEGDELSLADWDTTPDHGLVLRDDDGQLRYTPDPDFHGEDEISYTVTDGIREASGTITVTVNSVNDECLAFDDARQLSAVPETQNGASVLSNDKDFDGDAMAAELVTPPSAGTLDLRPDGTFSYTPPAGIDPEVGLVTSFTYRADDGHGSVTGPVTAMLYPWPLEHIPVDAENPPPPLVGTQDDIAIGDDPLSDVSVTANDSGWTRAFLLGHPDEGRLTKFDSDGYFDYTPRPYDRTDGSFSYLLVDEVNHRTATVPVNLVAVNATIYHGQDGAAVRGLMKMVGAFTVANLNDSDSDGQRDAIDNDGVYSRAADPPGALGEVDLMRFDIQKPNDPNPGNKKVKIEIVAGTGVKLWLARAKDPTVGDAIELPNNSKEYAMGDFPQGGVKTLWVELTEPSKAIADVKIDVTYDGATVTSRATGVWVEGQNQSEGDPLNPNNAWQGATFSTTNPNPWPDDANDPLKKTHQRLNNNQLGQRTNEILSKGADGKENTADDEVRTFNAPLMQFRFATDRLAQVAPGLVHIDIGRTITARVRRDGSDEAGPPFSVTAETHTPWTNKGVTWLDVVNDSPAPPQTDEDTDLHYAKDGREYTTRNVYSLDGPGEIERERSAAANYDIPGTSVPVRRVIYQINAFEFVRIKIGGRFVRGNDWVEGSRCSVYFYWHSRINIKSVPAAGGMWREWLRDGPAGDNDIGTGHKAFTI
jgi:hypothetical protein